MAMFKVLAGDFNKNNKSIYTGKAFNFMGYGFFKDLFSKGISITEVDSIEVKSENKEFKAGKAIGAGVLGSIALGPIGLLAAGLGKKNKAIVSVIFKDGRRALIEISGNGLKDIVKDLEIANY